MKKRAVKQLVRIIPTVLEIRLVLGTENAVSNVHFPSRK